MFTGLIETIGIVNETDNIEAVGRLSITIPDIIFTQANYGESIAINGVCLTLVEARDTIAIFDLVSSTMDISNLSSVKPSQPVNVERSARIGDRNGGHAVSGHVDCTARVIAFTKVGESASIKFQLPSGKAKYFINQGFVAINGASITVYDVNREQDTFEVWLIPETLSRTNLSQLAVGNDVNIEMDQTSKLVTDTIFEAVKTYIDKGDADTAGETAQYITDLVTKNIALTYSDYFDS